MLTPEMMDLIGFFVGALFSLMILSYLLGDNPLYRLALHLFVGAVVGYAVAVAVREVFIDLFYRLLARDVSVVVPIILGIFLLIKWFPRYAYLGNVSVGYLLGVGTAVALSGALLGTMVPQIAATGRALTPAAWDNFLFGSLDGLIILAGTVLTLMAFTFTTRKRRGLAGLWGRLASAAAFLGRIFLIIALAVAFAGAMTASLSIFIGRVQYFIDGIENLILRFL
jgi:hypothetical protein